MKSFSFLLLKPVWLLVKNDILAPFRAQWKKSIQFSKLMGHLNCTADFVSFVGFLLGFSRSVLPSATPWLWHFCCHLMTDTDQTSVFRGCWGSQQPLSDFVLSNVPGRWECPSPRNSPPWCACDCCKELQLCVPSFSLSQMDLSSIQSVLLSHSLLKTTGEALKKI